MDRRLGGAADYADKVQAGKASALVEQILGRKIGQPEILPPNRLFFAPMPIHDICQDPPSLLLVVPFRGIGRHIGRQSLDQGVDLDQPVGDLLVRRAVARLRAGHVNTVSDQLGPERFEPVAQARGGPAIVLVVGAHRSLELVGNRRRIAELQIGLEIGEGDICVGRAASRASKA